MELPNRCYTLFLGDRPLKTKKALENQKGGSAPITNLIPQLVNTGHVLEERA